MSPLEGRQRCEAKKEDGLPCQNLALKGLKVCRWHGDENTLSRNLVSPDMLKPAIRKHLRKLEQSIDAYEEIAHIRAWRDYVTDYIDKKSKSKPGPNEVKILIEANKEARAAIEAQTRIEYNKANLITQRDAAEFISQIISLAQQNIRNHGDLVRFMDAVSNYFSPILVSSSKGGGDGSSPED